MALTLPQIRAKADTILATIVTRATTAQATYLANHGKYWQGIFTPATIPVDGADAATDWTRKPTDQNVSWADLGITLPATIGATLQVDTHNGPQGMGYTIYAWATFNGRIFLKAAGTGPHSQTFDWVEMVPPVFS